MLHGGHQLVSTVVMSRTLFSFRGTLLQATETYCTRKVSTLLLPSRILRSLQVQLELFYTATRPCSHRTRHSTVLTFDVCSLSLKRQLQQLLNTTCSNSTIASHKLNSEQCVLHSWLTF